MVEIVTSAPRSQETLMFAEAAASGEAVRRQFAHNSAQFAHLGAHLRAHPPNAVITIGRGSSDHAAVYAKYLIETKLGIITSSAGLSVNSIYGTKINAENVLCLSISQSGKSPDLVSAVKGVRKAGAWALALVNLEKSPLADAANETIPLCAGPELSVAATKSYIAALASIASLVAHWSNDSELLNALEKLPDLLNQAWEIDWSPALETIARANNLFVLGRGLGYGVAREAALKFKETCSLHAEAYSAAEVLHGPAALVSDGFPILAFSQNDLTRASLTDTLAMLALRGGKIFAAGVRHPDIVELPTLNAHPALQPILMALSFYRMANDASILRGHNPDRPPHLSKVTETV